MLNAMGVISKEFLTLSVDKWAFAQPKSFGYSLN
jgi:hypothetical protein